MGSGPLLCGRAAPPPWRSRLSGRARFGRRVERVRVGEICANVEGRFFRGGSLAAAAWLSRSASSARGQRLGAATARRVARARGASCEVRARTAVVPVGRSLRGAKLTAIRMGQRRPQSTPQGCCWRRPRWDCCCSLPCAEHRRIPSRECRRCRAPWAAPHFLRLSSAHNGNWGDDAEPSPRPLSVRRDTRAPAASGLADWGARGGLAARR